MAKVISVVGARPQFVKLAPICRAMGAVPDLEHVVAHTGQHYDAAMSDQFFQELRIDEPRYNLGVGSGTHAHQTALMLVGLEDLLLDEKPDGVLVYGDTNSTLAAALAAAKLHLPVMHVEAGLRSRNRSMPEEINRVVTDHVSDVLFCPSMTAVDILGQEGIVDGVHFVGDVMYDAVLYAAEQARGRSHVLAELGVAPKAFALATVHRPSNTDHPDCLAAILAGLAGLGQPVVFPVHPRTRRALADHADALGPLPDNVRLVEPLGHLDMVALLDQAALLLTDSGGMQKEAFFLRVPCITMRSETEWVETVDAGWNQLVGADTERIQAAAVAWDRVDWSARTATRPEPYGDGHAAEKIVDLAGHVLRS